MKDTIDLVGDFVKLLGLSKREFVALQGGGHSLGSMHSTRSGYTGSWTSNPLRLDNEYFKNLLNEKWENITLPNGNQQFQAEGKNLYMLKTDLILKWDAEMMGSAQDFASDNTLFKNEFRTAWTKIMNADRFDGPDGNLCEKRSF